MLDLIPSAILAKQLVLPEQMLPRTQALMMKGEHSEEGGSTVEEEAMFLSLRTTFSRMLLADGTLISPASSGHAQSPIIL